MLSNIFKNRKNNIQEKFDNEYADKLSAENKTDEYYQYLSEWADKGDREAQYALGCYYKDTEGDTDLAAKWWRKAAEQGNEDAQYSLAVCSIGQPEAVEWFEKIADNDIMAQHILGTLYFDGLGVAKNQKRAAEWFRKAAEQGYDEAQYSLGKCYEYGTGVEQDDALAVKWYKAAADQGFAKAQYALNAYCNKDTVVNENVQKQPSEQDSAESLFTQGYFLESLGLTDEAVKYYIEAAEQGNETAQMEIAMCYYCGRIPFEKDVNRAAKLFKKTAEQGIPWVQNFLGNCYYYGKGVKEDKAMAAKWWSKAAEQGYINAQCRLGGCYYYGEGTEQNKALAVKWWSKAAEQGSDIAQFGLGVCYYNGDGIQEDKALAANWWGKAAAQGDAEAQFFLGKCYYSGDGVNINKTLAAEWWKKAAEQGNENAQCDLGICYYHGYGVERNKTLAAEWWSRSAAQSFKEAQFYLGCCYYYGDGVEQDMIQAVEWTKKSAEQGFSRAQYNLGIFYYHGIVVKENRSKALELFQKAADQGLRDAADILAELQKTEGHTESSNSISLDEYMAKTMALLSNMSDEILSLRLENVQLKKTLEDMETKFSFMHQTLIETKQLSNEINTTVKVISEDIKDIKSFIKTDLSREIKQAREKLNLQLENSADHDKKEAQISETLRNINDYINQNIQKCCDGSADMTAVENELRYEFGDNIWPRFAPYTRTALKSARMLWKQCKNLELETDFDYSGICICATSALENELKLLFFTGFQNYLEKTSHPNNKDWPKSLIYIKEGQGIAEKKRDKYFSMGSLPYLLDETKDKTYVTDSERKLMRDKRNKYLATVVNDKFITNNDPTLSFTQREIGGASFLSRCENIRKKYRNEAAHSERIAEKTAEQCYNEIVVNNLSDKIDAHKHLDEINNILLILYSILKDDYSPT